MITQKEINYRDSLNAWQLLRIKIKISKDLPGIKIKWPGNVEKPFEKKIAPVILKKGTYSPGCSYTRYPEDKTHIDTERLIGTAWENTALYAIDEKGDGTSTSIILIDLDHLKKYGTVVKNYVVPRKNPLDIKKYPEYKRKLIEEFKKELLHQGEINYDDDTWFSIMEDLFGSEEAMEYTNWSERKYGCWPEDKIMRIIIEAEKEVYGKEVWGVDNRVIVLRSK